MLAKFIFFKLLGWRFKGEFPTIPKCVIIVVPHSSWHDFYVGVFARRIIGLSMHFVGKKELFRPPLGWYFKWMGGAPIDRASKQNKVDQIAAIFESRKEFRLAIAPEGTRKYVPEWKSGFYYIAQKAKVPIVPVGFDYKEKQVVFFDTFETSDDYENDYTYLKNIFKNVHPKNEKTPTTSNIDK